MADPSQPSIDFHTLLSRKKMWPTRPKPHTTRSLSYPRFKDCAVLTFVPFSYYVHHSALKYHGRFPVHENKLTKENANKFLPPRVFPSTDCMRPAVNGSQCDRCLRLCNISKLREQLELPSAKQPFILPSALLSPLSDSAYRFISAQRLLLA